MATGLTLAATCRSSHFVNSRLYLTRPVPTLNGILSCLDLYYIREITSYTQRFTSYTDSVQLTDNRQTSHIELNVVFPDFAELWPDEHDNQLAAFDRFVDQASNLFPKMKMQGSPRLFETKADGGVRSAGRLSLDSQI